MFFDSGTGEKINIMPHQKEFDIWRGSLRGAEFENIVSHLNELINFRDNITLSEIIPGGKWSDSVFEPIFLKACFMDEKLSSMFLELIIWYVIQNRPDEWYYRSENAAGQKGNKYYFRKADSDGYDSNDGL